MKNNPFQRDASLRCVQSELYYQFFLVSTVVMVTAKSCIPCICTQLSSVDIVDMILQNYGIAQNVDKVFTGFLLIVWQYGQMLTLLTLLTPIYGRKRNTDSWELVTFDIL
jgi:hypothetical protein